MQLARGSKSGAENSGCRVLPPSTSFHLHDSYYSSACSKQKTFQLQGALSLIPQNVRGSAPDAEAQIRQEAVTTPGRA